MSLLTVKESIFCYVIHVSKKKEDMRCCHKCRNTSIFLYGKMTCKLSMYAGVVSNHHSRLIEKEIRKPKNVTIGIDGHTIIIK